MPCIHYNDAQGLPVHISLGGPEYTIKAGKKSYYFEMHSYFGPVVLSRKTGSSLSKQPGERNLFWRAVEHWNNQGRRVDDNGNCIFDWPPLPRRVHLVGNQYLALHNGDGPVQKRKEFFERIGMNEPPKEEV